MNVILSAGLVLLAVGALCAILLVIAAKTMAVPVDERFPAIRACLPGANCGACGYAGCDGYADALTTGEETNTNKCVPGASATAEALAEILGGTAEAVEPVVAFVHCKGGCDATTKKAEYDGTYSCAAVRLLYGGDKSCPFGCLGYGDCAAQCPANAIHIINGVAHINPDLCISCGQCVEHCPMHVISMIPKKSKTAVECSNREKGAAARKHCTKACIGCGKCMKNCEAEAIKVINNVAVIDYDKCVDCGTCAEVCPMHCIRASEPQNLGA